MIKTLEIFKKVLTNTGYILIYPFDVLFGLLKENAGKKKKKRKSKKSKSVKKAKKPEDLSKRVNKKIKELRNLWIKETILVRGFVLKKYSVFVEKLHRKRKKVVKKPKPIKKKRKIKFNFLSFLVGILFTVALVAVPFEIYRWFRELPNPEMLISESIGNRSTKILDKKGRLLYEIYVDRRYVPVRLNQIPKIVKQATLAVEDSEFYNHRGVRIDSILRAARITLLEGSLQGGSTVTQQLIKNVLLTPERTISRKLKEIVLALIVETKYSKDEIFELYLNNIPYGGTSWGIQTAAQKFFGKNVWELTLPEAAMLAGLPSAPTTYSPLVNFEFAKARQKYVLDRMVALEYITEGEAAFAFLVDLAFVEQNEYIRAPHFVDFVRRELESKYGKRFVDFGGLTITTSLDLDLQNEIQHIVTQGVIDSERVNITNGAAVILDPKSGQILAYVGSIDYFKEEWGAYDVVTALRQPGSSIKPVTYALALEKGFTPASIIKDSPVTYQVPGSRPYHPVNYDGRYHGNVTLRTALANSYNIPAVRLSKILGPDNIVGLGKQMGLSNWEVDGSYGLSITLGGKEIRLLDLTNAYAVFARGGLYREVCPFLSIKDSKGYEIYFEYEADRRILSEGVAYLIWHILSDNGARASAFGPRSSLVVSGYKVAVKTGTTDEKRDNWTLGFTPSYAIGVWVGNNDNTPMNRYLASGLSGAAPIWNDIMQVLLKDRPNEILERPEEVFVKYDKKCGRSEVFIKGSKVPAQLCPEEEDDKKDEDKDKKEKRDDT